MTADPYDKRVGVIEAFLTDAMTFGEAFETDMIVAVIRVQKETGKSVVLRFLPGYEEEVESEESAADLERMLEETLDQNLLKITMRSREMPEDWHFYVIADSLEEACDKVSVSNIMTS